MARTPKPSVVRAEDILSEGFAKVDQLSKRLDALKASYNNTAAELVRSSQQLPLPSFGLPAPDPPVVASGPRPSGRYFGPNPQSEPPTNPGSPQAKALHLVDRGGRSSRRTKSGRFFLQFSAASEPEELRKLREKVSKAGRVVDSGQGTASDPNAGWMEVAVRAEDTGSIILKLEEIDVSRDRVEKVVQVEPGEGRLQARQLDLYRKTGEG